MRDHQLLAYLECFISTQRKERFIQILEERTKFLTVAIEDVFQMHNTSAVIRSCEVFGIQEAHVIENRFGKRLDKKIAMGAQKWVDVQRYRTTAECIKKLRDAGYALIATTPKEGAIAMDAFKIEQKTALFFGTEKEGLSAELLESADGFLKIPMRGFTESLNISVSAAILLHHFTNQIRNSDLPWTLTPAQKFTKRLDWTKKSVRSIDDVLARFYEEH